VPIASNRPKHSGSVFAARCTLHACRPRLVNGYLTQMAPGDTTVGTTLVPGENSLVHDPFS
jgi:hypothetical protein